MRLFLLPSRGNNVVTTQLYILIATPRAIGIFHWLDAFAQLVAKGILTLRKSPRNVKAFLPYLSTIVETPCPVCSMKPSLMKTKVVIGFMSVGKTFLLSLRLKTGSSLKCAR